MKNKFLVIAFICALFQIVSVSKSFGQIQPVMIDLNTKDEFAVLYLKMKNEFQITDTKIHMGNASRTTIDTIEKRLRTVENQADILNYMSDQGWMLQSSQFALNQKPDIYPFAYVVHIYRRPKR